LAVLAAGVGADYQLIQSRSRQDLYLSCTANSCAFSTTQQGFQQIAGNDGQFRFQTQDGMFLDRASCHDATSQARLNANANDCGAVHWQYNSGSGELAEDSMKNCIQADGSIAHCTDKFEAVNLVSGQPHTCDSLVGMAVGKWDFIASINTNGTLSYALTVQTTHEDSATRSSSYSSSISTAIEAGFEFGGVDGSVTVTGTIANEVGQDLTTVLSQTNASVCTVSFPGPGSLYQWVVSFTDSCASSQSHTCSSVMVSDIDHPPCCPPGAALPTDSTYTKCLPEYQQFNVCGVHTGISSIQALQTKARTAGGPAEKHDDV